MKDCSPRICILTKQVISVGIHRKAFCHIRNLSVLVIPHCTMSRIQITIFVNKDEAQQLIILLWERLVIFFLPTMWSHARNIPSDSTVWYARVELIVSTFVTGYCSHFRIVFIYNHQKLHHSVHLINYQNLRRLSMPAYVSFSLGLFCLIDFYCDSITSSTRSLFC